MSILIPTLGRADPMVAEQARWLVQDNETKVKSKYKIFQFNCYLFMQLPCVIMRNKMFFDGILRVLQVFYLLHGIRDF